MTACPTIPTDPASISSAQQPLVGTVPVMAGAPFRLRTMAGDLVWDGLRLHVEPPTGGIADGVYTQVTIVNGVITSVGQAVSPGYTPGICG